MSQYADFRGTPIVVGSKIVYASMSGRSPKLTLGEVLAIGPPKDGSYYKVSIKVQPSQDSYGGRYSGREWDNEKKEYVRYAPPKTVILNFTDRLMVLE